MSEELALDDRKPWTVDPVIGRDPRLKGKRKKKDDPQVIVRHELRFNGKRVEKGITPAEVRRLHSMAETFNHMGATPIQLTRRGDIQTDFFDGLQEAVAETTDETPQEFSEPNTQLPSIR